MKPIFHLLKLLMVLLFFLCSCSSQPMNYTAKTYDSNSVIAVWDLENYSLTENQILDNLEEFLSAKVAETLMTEGEYIIVEREKLLLALEELNISSSTLTNENNRLQVGHMVGAQLMVFGAYQQFGDQLRIDLRLVDVETGVVVRTSKLITTATDVSELLVAAKTVAEKLLPL